MRDGKMMNAVILKALRGTSGYVSGEQLSAMNGISRAAIHKRITFLREAGYEIESVTKKGYRLLSCPDTIDDFLLLSEVETSLIGRNIITLDEVDSTNEYAKKIASESPEGTVVIADAQYKGKGRRGRSFYSQKGSGLFFSVILKPDIAPQKAPFITGIGSCALVLVLEDLGKKAQIKWPNDVWMNGKKISGILTEMSGDIEKVEYIVLGIGVNVRNTFFPKEIESIASSLELEGLKISRQQLFCLLMKRLEELYMDYLRGEHHRILRILTEYSCILGKEIVIHNDKEVRYAYALSIDEDGALVVSVEGGGKRRLNSGEVSIRESGR